MNQPFGHVQQLNYQDVQPDTAADTSALVVSFTAPDAREYEQFLSNPEWSVRNPALQFMALHGIQPSDVSGPNADVRDWQWMVPLAADGEGSYALAENALQGGVRALRNADWFGPSDDTKTSSRVSQAHTDDTDDDPSSGDQGAVEFEGDEDIEAELTPEDDTGVNITVE